ncbi:MAG: Dabb family protein [Defluviitaleaceae bacterium]|nr:Dabb family protein [Defluviitaleaceae bacterium]
MAAYQTHPEHKRVSEFVGSVMQNRACIDYYE